MKVKLLYFDVRTGNWKADRFEGWGRVEYTDTSVYDGELRGGLREGQVT